MVVRIAQTAIASSPRVTANNIPLSRDNCTASCSAVGFLCVDGQCGINALAAALYSTSARSTGVGWALGAGRVGSIIGPLIGGVIIARQWTLQQIYLLAAIPALIAAVVILCMRLKGVPADVTTTYSHTEVQG
ncbi:MFS transporter [Alicyclobacillus shizuokensis]|uniref:MFS transporter n=1 Tax=Alicyclobacillus shizuokensis TaxID=392014 RepID=UPI0012EE8DDC